MYELAGPRLAGINIKEVISSEECGFFVLQKEQIKEMVLVPIKKRDYKTIDKIFKNMV